MMDRQKAPAKASTPEKTGEFGFCTVCGNPVAVEMAFKDRLRYRLVRAAAVKAARAKGFNGDPLQELRAHLTNALVSSTLAQSLANYGLVEGDAQRNSRSAVIELRRHLQELMTELVISEAQLAAWLGQPVDLLREATEELERETDVIGGRDGRADR